MSYTTSRRNRSNRSMFDDNFERRRKNFDRNFTIMSWFVKGFIALVFLAIVVYLGLMLTGHGNLLPFNYSYSYNFGGYHFSQSGSYGN